MARWDAKFGLFEGFGKIWPGNDIALMHNLRTSAVYSRYCIHLCTLQVLHPLLYTPVTACTTVHSSYCMHYCTLHILHPVLHTPGTISTSVHSRYCSTSPKVEPPSFCEHMRGNFRYILTHLTHQSLLCKARLQCVHLPGGWSPTRSHSRACSVATGRGSTAGTSWPASGLLMEVGKPNVDNIRFLVPNAMVDLGYMTKMVCTTYINLPLQASAILKAKASRGTIRSGAWRTSGCLSTRHLSNISVFIE